MPEVDDKTLDTSTVVEDVGQPSEIEFVPPLDDVGEVQTDEGEVTKEDLLKQVQEQEKQLKALEEANAELAKKQQGSSSDTIIQGFKEAVKELKPKQVDDGEVEIDKEKFNSEFFEDPMGAATKLADKLYGKKIQAMEKDSVQMYLQMSKSSAKGTDKWKWIFDTYEKEVDAVINATPLNVLKQTPNPYEAAAKMVLAQHVDEYTEMLLNKKQGEEKKDVIKKVPFTETSTVSGGSNGKVKKITLTKEMIEYKEKMERMGLDGDDALRRKYGNVS